MPTTLNEGIRKFYDQSTPLWLDIWGEHMHHGFYETGDTAPADHREAQVELLRRLTNWADIRSVSNALDAGCGVGGSARFLAQTYGAEVLGVTLSPVQAKRAARYNELRGLDHKVTVRVEDMMRLPTHPPRYDLIWSLESAEHISAKDALIHHFYDMLVPSGKLLLVTWCTRAPHSELTEAERRLLTKIQHNYHLPPMVPMTSYAKTAHSVGFEDIQTADWTENVAQFWKAVMDTALSWRGLRGLLGAGLETIKGAWTMRYMAEGYRSGLLQFALLRATKPAQQ